MSNLLKNIFTPRTGKSWIVSEHRGWGDAIHMISMGEWDSYGLTTPRPNVGDIFLAEMESGKLGEYLVTKIKYEHDPRDMWFAKLLFLGYARGITESKEARSREGSDAKK